MLRVVSLAVPEMLLTISWRRPLKLLVVFPAASVALPRVPRQEQLVSQPAQVADPSR